MTTNLLIPGSADDVAEALLHETRDPGLPWRGLIARRLAQELRCNPEHAIEARTLPTFAPAWAASGKVHYILPSARIRAEVGVVADAARRAANVPESLRRRNSTLARRCEEMLEAFERETWPALSLRAANLCRSLVEWSRSEKLRRRLNRRQRRAAAAPGAEGRTWRSVESIAQLLERGKGASWCLLKDEPLADEYFDRFVAGDLSFWTLHDEDGRTLALLTQDEDREPGEIRNVRNQPATEFREDVAVLARAGAIHLKGQSADVEALAFDPDLGRRGQTFREGVIEGRRCRHSIQYRLWSDGRRRRYLIETGGGSETPSRYLRLDASGKCPAWGSRVNGAADPAWRGSKARAFPGPDESKVIG
ncbi:MAG: hypothetical protein ACRED8_03035, partial [Caulobacteraceae bacterium]